MRTCTVHAGVSAPLIFDEGHHTVFCTLLVRLCVNRELMYDNCVVVVAGLNSFVKSSLQKYAAEMAALQVSLIHNLTLESAVVGLNWA